MAEKKYDITGGLNQKIGRTIMTKLCFERTGNHNFDSWLEDKNEKVYKEARMCWQNLLPEDDVEFAEILAEKHGLEI